MAQKIPSSEITPEHIYLSRRKFMTGAGALAATAAILGVAGCNTSPTAPAASGSNTAQSGAPAKSQPEAPAAVQPQTDELGDPLNTFEAITNYNNYYEFTTTKEDVAAMAQGFTTSPWQVEVGGLVNNPKTFGMEELLRFEQEERIYRLRCVEAWSMVIPWVGFPLRKLLEEVDPKSDAKFVRFETVFRPEEMPGQRSPWYTWPYVEGLRMDEAMHDLTLMATGLYGKDLLPQSGAPLRLVVPWKYGFKSIKSIVKIDLVDKIPVSLWMAAAPNEYGFFANVNPAVSHPRWSQATERRIGEFGRRATLPFNGYANEVAHLYDGMDLSVFF
ncbi:MAG: protein-methionine-sulfoxide reductase catalytic subunit MsrP [Chloroflexi bacterium]|nr:MAG: protein-methionine-sulfoxide reductase catalytic subunit MsrP [Chloroflexota bacterium]